MRDPAWRRWVLFAALAVLCVGYCASYLLFRTRSVDFTAAAADTAARVQADTHATRAPAVLAFAAGREETHLLGRNWNVPEESGTWSSASDALVMLNVQNPGPQLVLRFDVSAYTSRSIRSNRIAIRINGELAGTVERRQDAAEEPFELKWPTHGNSSEYLRLEIGADHCQSPILDRKGADVRMLCVLLRSISLRADDAPDQ